MGYWEDRQLETYLAGEKKIGSYFYNLERAFNQTKRELNKTIEAFYFRYAQENNITFAAAQKQLSKMELLELADFIQESKKNFGRYSQALNNLSMKSRITRYQALEAQVDAMLTKLYAVDYQEHSEKIMREICEDSYNRTWYNIDRYKGYHSHFATVDERMFDTLIKYPFNGANFSTRLWKQKEHLQSTLMEALTTGLIQGQHPSKLAAEFAKKMNTKKFEAYRLLHTEMSYLMNEATHTGYKADGVEKYQILATLDSKTCAVCGEKDEEIYKLSDGIVGSTMPPFHPLCRCTDVPYYDDDDITDMERVARDENGEYVKVPVDMSYKEWKGKFFDGKSGKELTGDKQGDIIISGAKITNLFSEEANRFAEMYYKEIRSFSTDTKKIAENLGKDHDEIKMVKDYLFMNKSLYDESKKEWIRFHPDCAIAQSWQRLMLEKDIKPHDRTLIEHELLEMKIKNDNPEISHSKAHELATKKFDYQKEVEEYYGNFEKNKKNR